ncbi:MAG: prepilin-type N-terminal cleavage/methylation domain-containing protein [Gammaproteobacteria bacterium]|nr:prepilin-type N-terminal cleavage/methylation domain-containing protein [Gammaproteobacteria bacterium]
MNQLKNTYKICKGFSLIEVAIVMVIIGLLISAAIMPLGSQRDTNNLKKVIEELKNIEQAILGFAVANGRLPCPSLPADAGMESRTGEICNNNSMGFIPAATLGISGNVNCDNLLVDPWGNPYRYSVTTSSAADDIAAGNPVNGPDFTISGELKFIFQDPLIILNPDLQICTDSTCGTVLTDKAVAVIFSMGKRWSSIASANEIENSDGIVVASGCTTAYAMPGDVNFISSLPIETGNVFDDIVIWISPNILYAKLLAAGKL